MAKYINKFKDENEYDDKKMYLDYPSINYIESLDEIVWLKEMPPFKYYITDLDGNIIYSKPFDENDTELHYEDFYEFNNDWKSKAYGNVPAYGDFVIGDGITGGEQLFFDSSPYNVQKFSVQRLVIPSTWDNRIPVTDPETGEPIPGEYDYCNGWKNVFGTRARYSPYNPCGMIQNSVYIERGAQLSSLFADCPIEHLDLSDFEYDGQIFSSMCLLSKNLSSVTFPSSITSLSCNVFQNCNNLEELNGYENITRIENYALDGTSNLRNFEIPSGVTYIGVNAFNGSGVENITIPSGVTEIGAGSQYMENAFKRMPNLTSFTLNSQHILDFPCIQRAVSIEHIDIPDWVSGVTNACFENCYNLSNVRIGSGVTVIGEYSFSNCRLSALTIPSGVTEIGAYAFYGSETEYNPFEYILFEGTTPATLQPSYNQFDNNTGATYPLYVPQSAVNTYKSAGVWLLYASRISGYTYEWQTVQDEYRCDNGDKYAVEEKVINIESGTSYIHTGEYRQGSLIESGSTDCAYADVRLYHFEAESDSPRFTVPMTFDTSYKYTMEFTPVDWPSEQEMGGDDNYYGGIIGQENNNERGLVLFKLDNGWGYPEYRTSAGFNGYDLSTNNDGSPTFGAYRFYDGVKATVTLEGVQDGAKITVENEGYQTYTATSTNYLNSSLSDGDTFNIFMFCNEYDDGNGFNPPANMIFHSFTVRDSNDNLVYEYKGYDNQDGTYSLIDTVSENTYSIPSIYTTDPDEP